MSKFYRFAVNKLARENDEKLFKEQGITCHQHPIQNDDFIHHLKNKLLEETNEVLEAASTTDLTEELADLLEIIYTLANASNISMEEIKAERRKKVAQRGTYNNKVFCTYVDVEESSPRLSHFRAKSHKYPEIKLED